MGSLKIQLNQLLVFPQKKNWSNQIEKPGRCIQFAIICWLCDGRTCPMTLHRGNEFPIGSSSSSASHVNHANFVQLRSKIRDLSTRLEKGSIKPILIPLLAAHELLFQSCSIVFHYIHPSYACWNRNQSQFFASLFSRRRSEPRNRRLRSGTKCRGSGKVRRSNFLAHNFARKKS